jgi:hypothetical protein
MKRRATSLMETIVAIGLSGTILTVVAALLVTLWSVEQVIQEDLDERQSLARLEIALRRDVHEALAGEPAGEGGLRLTLAGGKVVEYSVVSERIERLQRAGDATVHREPFVLAHGVKITFAADDPQSPDKSLVRLTVEPAAAADRNSRRIGRWAVLEAALGSGRVAANRTEPAP